MLDEIFMQVIDMTKTASIVIMVVLAVRLVLKKAPKVFSFALWAAVLIRLLCPLSIESPVTLIPRMEPTAEGYTLAEEPISVGGASVAAYQAVGDALNGGLGIQHIRTTETNENGNVYYATSTWWEVWILFGQYVWIAGIAVLVLYSAVSYFRLRRRLVGAALLRENIYLTDHIGSPFVMGLIRPKIYLPSNLSQQEQRYILAHEQHHIRRFDHITRALSYLALCIHWFNPLVWVAFFLSGKDMEMSCDEAVVKKLGDDIRADYSASLLQLATGRRVTAGMPLAFGEGDTGGRIRNLAGWKKPALWLSGFAAAAVLVLAALLLTNPAKQQTTLLGADYSWQSILYNAGLPESVGPETTPAWFSVTANYHLYMHDQGDPWEYVGKMEPYDLTNEELTQLTAYEDGWEKHEDIGEITDAYILTFDDGYFYLIFQTQDGKSYFGDGWEDISERHQAGSDDTRLGTLIRVKNDFEKNSSDFDYFSRTLSLETGMNVDPFHYWSSTDFPDYAVVGFLAGEETSQDMTDMGFAVFYTGGGTGYKLIDCHQYENAALTENGIYFCENPAVLSTDRICTDANSFDVILSVNEDLTKIVRTYHYDDRNDKTVTEHIGGHRSMTLFSWAEAEESNTISQYYYDAGENLIEDYGIGPVQSTQSSSEQRFMQISDTLAFGKKELSGVERIVLTNCHNGKKSEITDAQQIRQIVAFMEGVSGKNVESSKGYYEGSYSLTFHYDDWTQMSVTFGDSDTIYCGNFGDGYLCRYQLEDMQAADAIRFLSLYDSSGFIWDLPE